MLLSSGNRAQPKLAVKPWMTLRSPSFNLMQALCFSALHTGDLTFSPRDPPTSALHRFQGLLTRHEVHKLIWYSRNWLFAFWFVQLQWLQLVSRIWRLELLHTWAMWVAMFLKMCTCCDCFVIFLYPFWAEWVLVQSPQSEFVTNYLLVVSCHSFYHVVSSLLHSNWPNTWPEDMDFSDFKLLICVWWSGNVSLLQQSDEISGWSWTRLCSRMSFVSLLPLLRGSCSNNVWVFIPKGDVHVLQNGCHLFCGIGFHCTVGGRKCSCEI